MIETIAISSGTNASSEANTNASTTSAPSPPSTDSRNTPGPPLPPVWLCSASIPVTRTGAPATAVAGQRRLGPLGGRVLVPKDSLSGGG